MVGQCKVAACSCYYFHVIFFRSMNADWVVLRGGELSSLFYNIYILHTNKHAVF